MEPDEVAPAELEEEGVLQRLPALQHVVDAQEAADGPVQVIAEVCDVEILRSQGDCYGLFAAFGDGLVRADTGCGGQGRSMVV